MLGPLQSMGAKQKQKPAAMPKLERSPSHSWWWDSHNSPKHSKWLQSNLQDLDEKVKEMLRLIQEDADSFAQRAEMYYQKRPELVNLVEAFYRAYRSLAERYDHLTGEIRQNIPRALQVQYGLSCDSPRVGHTNGGEHRNSPLRRSSQMKKARRPSEDLHQAEESDRRRDDAQGKCLRNASMKENEEEQNGHGDPSFDAAHRNLSDRGYSSSSSDMEVDDSAPLARLKQEIDAMKESNRALTVSHQKALELNASLLTRIRELEEGHGSKDEEGDALRSKADARQAADLQHLETTISEDGHGILLANDAEGKELQAEILPHLEEEMDFCAGEEDMRRDYAAKTPKDLAMAEPKHEGEHAGHKITQEEEQGRAAMVDDGLQRQITELKREVLERGEEKRAAIRQLCFTMDILRSNNRRLEVALALLKEKMNGSSGADARRRSPNAAWKQLVAMEGWRWRPFMNRRGATVAL